MTASTSQRVLIIDGHPAVGRGLKALVGNMPGLRVVGLATRGENGLAQAAEATPDVALVDADLPGLCSEAVIRLLRSRLPMTRIVALGIYPERKWTLLTAGAHEFVLKDAGYDALQHAIEGPATEPPGDVRDATIATTSAAVAGPAESGKPARNAERVLP